MYWVSCEKEERRDDLVGRRSCGCGGGKREEAPSGAWVLSLPGSSMSQQGEEKEKGNWISGDDGFPSKVSWKMSDTGGRG